MKETEGTWLDFDGKAFGKGAQKTMFRSPVATTAGGVGRSNQQAFGKMKTMRSCCLTNMEQTMVFGLITGLIIKLTSFVRNH